jgi:hypothetical protein
LAVVEEISFFTKSLYGPYAFLTPSLGLSLTTQIVSLYTSGMGSEDRGDSR